MSGENGRLRAAEVVVVGAGHNGLVAACYLAKAGLDVLVVERRVTPGGMTSTNPMAPEHMIDEASIHASQFRTTSIDAELELPTRAARDHPLDDDLASAGELRRRGRAAERRPGETAEPVASA